MKERSKLFSLLNSAVFFKSAQKALSVFFASLCLGLIVADVFLVIDPFSRFTDTACLAWHRIILAVLLLGPLGAAAVFFLARPTKEKAAIDLERTHPEAGERNILINSFQFFKTMGSNPAYTLFLRKIASEAARFLPGIAPRRVFNASFLKPVAMVIAVTALVCTSFYMISSEYFIVSLKRLALPWLRIQPIIRTKIEPLHERFITVARGDTIELKTRITGRVPAVSFIHYRFESKRWAFASQKDPLFFDPKTNTFDFNFRNVPESFSFYYSAGDNTTDEYRVRAVMPPEIEKVEYVFNYPLYTSRGRKIESGSIRELSVPAGTTIELRPYFNKEMQKCELLLGNTQTVPFTLSRDGLSAYGLFRAQKDTEFTITARDRDGFWAGKNTHYRLRLEKDTPPTVDMQAMPDKKSFVREESPRFRIKAEDNYGIGSMKLELLSRDAKELTVLKEWEYMPIRKTVEENIDIDFTKDVPDDLNFFLLRLRASDANNIEGAHETVKDFGPYEILSLLRLRLNEIDNAALILNGLEDMIFDLCLFETLLMNGQMQEKEQSVHKRITDTGAELDRIWKTSIDTMTKLELPVKSYSGAYKTFSILHDQILSADSFTKTELLPELTAAQITKIRAQLENATRNTFNIVENIFLRIYEDHARNIISLQNSLLTTSASSERAKTLIQLSGDLLQAFTGFEEIIPAGIKPAVHNTTGKIERFLQSSTLSQNAARQISALESRNPTALIRSTATQINKVLQAFLDRSWMAVDKGVIASGADIDAIRHELKKNLESMIKAAKLERLSAKAAKERFDGTDKEQEISRLLNDLLVICMRNTIIINRSTETLFKLKALVPEYGFLGYEELTQCKDLMKVLVQTIKDKDIGQVLFCKEDIPPLFDLICILLKKNIDALSFQDAGAKEEKNEISVEIIEPGKNVKLHISDSLKLAIQVLSESGTQKVELYYKTGDDPEFQSIDILDQASIKNELNIEYDFPVNSLNPQHGTLTRYYVKATQQAVVNPLTAQSEEYLIESIAFGDTEDKAGDENEVTAEDDMELINQLLETLIIRQHTVNDEFSAMMVRIKTKGTITLSDIEEIRLIEEKQQVIEISMRSLVNGLQKSISNWQDSQLLLRASQELMGILTEDFKVLKANFQELKTQLNVIVAKKR